MSPKFSFVGAWIVLAALGGCSHGNVATEARAPAQARSPSRQLANVDGEFICSIRASGSSEMRPIQAVGSRVTARSRANDQCVRRLGESGCEDQAYCKRLVVPKDKGVFKCTLAPLSAPSEVFEGLGIGEGEAAEAALWACTQEYPYADCPRDALKCDEQ